MTRCDRRKWTLSTVSAATWRLEADFFPNVVTSITHRIPTRRCSPAIPRKPVPPWVWRPLPESCQLAPFSVGSDHYITSEDDEKTYLGTLQSDNKLIAKLAVERGGTSVVTDTAGNIYIASGQGMYTIGKVVQPGCSKCQSVPAVWPSEERGGKLCLSAPVPRFMPFRSASRAGKGIGMI